MAGGQEPLADPRPGPRADRCPADWKGPLRKRRPVANDGAGGCYIGAMPSTLRMHAALVTALLAAVAAGPAAARPNILFLLLDDMGYADTGAYGNTYHRTPNIDRLAREGVRFTDAYAAAPNCSPTRASILTGMWPARTGLTQYLPGNVLPHARLLQADLPLGLPLDSTVVAQPLSGAGYATACVGKWHLGAGAYAPERRGFDESFASGHWGSHRRMFAPHQLIKVPGARDGHYLTDGLTRAALAFIERNRDRPFFLYMSYYSVHGPIQAKPDLIDGYADRRDPSGRNHAVYAAMVEGVDQSVGRLLDALDRLGIASSTAVFFFSDNGGVPSRAFNGGFRSGKGYLWEGGIREPLIVRWPDQVREGRVEGIPVSSVDFYPTMLEMAGVDTSSGPVADGVSLLPLLQESGALERDTLYWHYPHYSNAGSPPTGALRKEEWKLIEFFEDSHVELYNLASDPSESVDVADAEPDRARAMLGDLREWRESVGAVMPRQNPDFDAARQKQRRPLSYKAYWDPDAPLRSGR